MAFEQNLSHVLASLEHCRSHGCGYRAGVELELSGYFCGEHFKERETHDRVWQSVRKVLSSGLTKGLLVELGLPVQHNGRLYSCMLVMFDQKILYLRPKCTLSRSNLYDESRYFTAYDKAHFSEFFILPNVVSECTGQDKVPFGKCYARLDNFSCIQIFRSELESPLLERALKACATVVSVANSGFYELGRSSQFAATLQTIAQRGDSHIVVSSLHGSEDAKLMFEGGCLWASKDEVKEIGEALSLRPAIIEHVELPAGVSQPKPAAKKLFKAVKVSSSLAAAGRSAHNDRYKVFGKKDDEEELLNAMSGYIWDQLTKSKASGFFVPLSGGADSSLVSFTVYYMCKRVFESPHDEVRYLFARVTGRDFASFDSPEQLTKAILFTAYLPSAFSGVTRANAEKIAQRINANFMSISIHKIYEAFKGTIESALDIKTDFKSGDSFVREDLALQNLQARIRLVLGYLCAQLLPVKFNLPSFLLCFATGNLSEVLRGYYTKYDCSSGDLNIIGSLNKTDIKRLLVYSSKKFDGFEVLASIAMQRPTAELRPGSNGPSEQTDEGEMGFTYEELDFLGEKMKVGKMGREQLVEAFHEKYPSGDSQDKVDRFLEHFRRNRHKAAVLPYSVHLTNYDIDGAFDPRPVLYMEDLQLAKRDRI